MNCLKQTFSFFHFRNIKTVSWFNQIQWTQCCVKCIHFVSNQKQELIAWNKPSFHFFHFTNIKTETDHHKISKKQMIHKCNTPNAMNYFGSLFRRRIFSLYWPRKKCFKASLFQCYLLLCTENEIKIRMDECVPFATL